MDKINLPKIKKKISSFLLSEEGQTTKSSIIKFGLLGAFITALQMSVHGVLADHGSCKLTGVVEMKAEGSYGGYPVLAPAHANVTSDHGSDHASGTHCSNAEATTETADFFTHKNDVGLEKTDGTEITATHAHELFSNTLVASFTNDINAHSNGHSSGLSEGEIQHQNKNTGDDDTLHNNYIDDYTCGDARCG